MIDRAEPGEPRQLEQLLEPAIDEPRIAANWQQIQHVRRRRHRGRSPRRWAVRLAVIAVAVAVGVIMWPGRGGPLTATTVEVHAGAIVDTSAAQRVHFNDDSRVDFAAGTRLEVLSNEADRFVTLLHRGRARFDVHPGGPRRWEVETSRATVEVVGTAFSVEASEHRVSVEVERGVVIVRGERVPGRIVRLTAGDKLALEDPDHTARRATSEHDRSAPPAPSATPELASGARPDPAIPPDAIAEHELAEAIASADLKRATGDARGAAAVLEHALRGLRHDEVTGLVAFTLGRIYLEDLGMPARAVSAFERTIAIGAPRGLLEDAYARRIEALVRARRHADAATARDEYDRRYPRGARRGTVHALFLPPEAR